MNNKTPMKRTKDYFSNFEKAIEGLFYKKEKQQQILANIDTLSDFIFCDFLRVYQLLNEANLSFAFHFKNKEGFLPIPQQSVEIKYSVKGKHQSTTCIFIEEFCNIMKEFNKELNQIDSEDRHEFHSEIEELILKHFFEKYNIDDAFLEFENQLVNNNELQFKNLKISQTSIEMLSSRIKNKTDVYDQFCLDSPEAREIKKIEELLESKKKDFEVLQSNKYKELMLRSDKILLQDTKKARDYLIEKIENSSKIINQVIRLPVLFLKSANKSIIEKYSK